MMRKWGKTMYLSIMCSLCSPLRLSSPTLSTEMEKYFLSAPSIRKRVSVCSVFDLKKSYLQRMIIVCFSFHIFLFTMLQFLISTKAQHFSCDCCYCCCCFFTLYFLFFILSAVFFCYHRSFLSESRMVSNATSFNQN